MIVHLTESEKPDVLRYIGDERGRCLYMYMDILKFGLNSPEVSVWAQQADGEIAALMMKYHNGFHVYAKRTDADFGETAGLIRQIKPGLVCGEGPVVQSLSAALPEYVAEYGVIYKLGRPCACADKTDIRTACPDDFRQVARMLKADDDYGSGFTLEELEAQFRGRQESGLSRSLVLRQGNEVVAHVATGAETADVATVNGLVVAESLRHRGLATKVMNALCAELQSEGKDVFSAVYVEPSANLHRKIGFCEYCSWGKMFAAQGPDVEKDRK